jgi:prepilin-type processing-associated H-X9-DG protein
VRGPGARRGYTAIDVLVAVFLVGLLALILLMAMPRGREAARLSACQRSLSQIGMALALYDQTQRCFPAIGGLASIDAPSGQAPSGPLKMMLEAFGLPNFLGLSPASSPPQPSGPVPGEVPVPGFVCASDPRATASPFRAPISYRGTTGGDHLGRDGVFAPGRRIGLRDVEWTDGASYTAAFAERLVGDGIEDHFTPWNYAAMDAPLPAEGCNLLLLKDRGARWHGDAGSSWVPADYRSTLYNHGLLPNAQISCLADDGRTAFMGASSGHVRGVNLLMVDGSVKIVVPTVARSVWTEFAAIATNPPPAKPVAGRTR